jgi:hypothetical protein
LSDPQLVFFEEPEIRFSYDQQTPHPWAFIVGVFGNLLDFVFPDPALLGLWSIGFPS